MRISLDGWIIIGLVAAAVIIALTFGSGSPRESDLSTSYSNDGAGTKAVYTLLGDRLGYNVDRLRQPYNEMPRDAAVLVCVAPLKQIPIEPEETRALDDWIRQGGTAIFISDWLLHVPPQYAKNRKLGKGFIYAFNSRRVVTNKGAKDYRNTMEFMNLIANHSRTDDLILFDEYHHGLGRSELTTVLLQLGRPIKIGAVVIAIGLLVLGYGRGSRFGAVRSLPASQSRRPEFEFVESVARLYDRSGAAGLAAGILVKSLRQNLCLKLGISSDAPRHQIINSVRAAFPDWPTFPDRAGFAIPPAEKIERLLTYEQAGQKMSKAELLRVAQEIHSVEKELGLVRTNR